MNISAVAFTEYHNTVYISYFSWISLVQYHDLLSVKCYFFGHYSFHLYISRNETHTLIL